MAERAFRAVALTVSLTLCAVALRPAQARPAAAFAGRPQAMQAGLPARIWVWTDAAGLHVRWTSAGEPRRFGVTVARADGPLGPVRPFPDVLVAQVARPDASTAVVEGRAAGTLSGVDAPLPPEGLTLAPTMDGAPAPVHAIRLGATEIRPKRYPVVVPPAQPEATGDEHHAHPHPHTHDPGDHHHHAHPHPHPPGTGHHHPW